MTRRNGRRQGEAGQAIVIMIGAILVTVAMVATIVDGGNVLAQQRVTQNGADATAEAGAVILAERLDKTVVVSQDFPGFIVNRVLIPMVNEAIYALYEGVASAEDIDTAMKLGTNQPMGPLTLADFIGLDTVLAICEVLHGGLGDPKYRPCPLLRQYVAAGRLGRKSGRGFFNYQAVK